MNILHKAQLHKHERVFSVKVWTIPLLSHVRLGTIMFNKPGIAGKKESIKNVSILNERPIWSVVEQEMEPGIISNSEPHAV